MARVQFGKVNSYRSCAKLLGISKTRAQELYKEAEQKIENNDEEFISDVSQILLIISRNAEAKKRGIENLENNEKGDNSAIGHRRTAL